LSAPVPGRDYTRPRSGAPFGRKQIVQCLKFEAAAPPVTERPRSKLVFAPMLCLIRMARFGNKRSFALSICIQFNFPFLRAHFQRCNKKPTHHEAMKLMIVRPLLVLKKCEGKTFT
jgi:hypothetical protein